MKSFSLLIKFISALLLINLGFGPCSNAQDTQFSQYYNLIQYQNPAFVGSSYAWRGILHSRIQWPGLDSRYLTNVAAFDYNWAKYNSGLGSMFIHDDQGNTSIKSDKLIFQYSYLLHLSNSLTLRSGLSLAYNRRVLNNASLYYPDQFTGSGFNNQDNPPRYVKNYVDLGAGLLLYSKDFWLSISSSDMNSPNISFIGSSEKMRTRFDASLGYKIRIKSNATMRYLEEDDEEVWALYPTVLYKWQGKSDQVDLGLYTIYKVVKLGLWYRGIPVKKYNNQLPNNESIIALAGFKLENFSMGYSYDFVVSKLWPYSRGAHEINLTILYPKKKNFKQKYKYKRLPCPDFH